MLTVLPIIPSRISHNFYSHYILILFSCHHLLFLLYSLNFYCVSDDEVPHTGVSGISGMEWWNGIVEWNTGMGQKAFKSHYH